MTTTRPSYHHGNLRAALLEAAAGLARAGGPDAVVLREVTRRAGVSHNAAYRHFADRDALLDEVCTLGMGELAEAMSVALARVDREQPGLGGGARARARLSAVGRAYVEYALAQPGLFRTAFAVPDRVPSAGSRPEPGVLPYQLLSRVLDEMVDQGAMAPDRRPGAETACWASVHGFATLCLDGPLRMLGEPDREALLAALLATVDRGLS